MPKIINDAQVFQAVMEVIQKEGYIKATTKRLAEAADIHETTLFEKYGSKVELIMQTIAFHVEKSPLKSVCYTGNIRDDLILAMKAYQETITLFGDFINAIILHIPSDDRLSEVVAMLLEDIQPIISLIEKYQEQGMLKQGVTLQTTGELIAPLFMLHTFSKALEGIDIPEIDFEDRVENFLHGFGTT